MNKLTLIVFILALLGSTASCKKLLSVKPQPSNPNSNPVTGPGPASVHPEYFEINNRYPFSASVPRLRSKQGIGEARTIMSDTELDQRYSKLKSLGTSYRQYNLWWSGLESSGLSSSKTPLSCPADYQMIPANETERIALGYHKYRCVNSDFLKTFDKIFQRDMANGMQSGVVLWSSPPVYRYSDCQGFAFGGNYLKDGCVPRDDAMDDFEDYINLVAARYNGDTKGKITHFIIWNENASPDWFDYTPITSKKSLTSSSINKRIDKYADMLKRTHAALTRNQKKALMYASTDQIWDKKSDGHMGSKTLIDGLWSRLGLEYSWSVAVHPYGNVDDKASSGTYTFNNLEIVVEHQFEKLRAAGVNDPYIYPQSLIIASEQGWPITSAAGFSGALGRENQARQICLAHEKAMTMSQLTAVAHNYFHSVEPAEMEANGQSGQGAFFGLIPNNIPNNLSGMETVSTGKAMASTLNPKLWKLSDDHYCCKIYNLGCRTQTLGSTPSVEDTHKLIGVIDGVTLVNKNPVITGWACVRSVETSTTVHLYAGGSSPDGGTMLAPYYANIASEPAVSQSCAVDGAAYRFIIPVTPQMSASYGGLPIFIHGISTLGLDNNLLTNSGKFFIPNPETNSPALDTLVKIPVYRFFKDKDHLMTSNLSEGTNAGYANEGFKFYLFQNAANFDLVPLYRCYSTNDHFLSPASNCEGAKVEGLLGYILKNQIDSTRPVYRYYKASTGQHLITTDTNEANVFGFTLESILGYAL